MAFYDLIQTFVNNSVSGVINTVNNTQTPQNKELLKSVPVETEVISQKELMKQNVPVETRVITQIELMKLIHEQFQIPAIKKLYPKWTERVFWVIHGNIYHQFDDLSMDRLSEHIVQYITEHGYPVYRSQVPRVTAAIEQMNRSGWK